MTHFPRQQVPTWKESECKQVYQSTNDEKNERIPVVAFGLFQNQDGAHEMRDVWMGHSDSKKYFVRSFQRKIRVDTILTTVYCTVVRRRDQIVMDLDDSPKLEQCDVPESQLDIEEETEPEEASDPDDDDLPF